MRLFIAVDLDPAPREAVQRISKALESRLAAGGLAEALRWVPPANRHLTLCFLGEVSDSVAARVRGVLEAPLAVPAFHVSLGGLGIFPRAGAPRVLWMGVEEGADAFGRLHGALCDRLRPCVADVTQDGRAFTPHLTLGRFRRPPRGPIAAIHRALRVDDAGASGGWLVDRVTLYRSQLTPRGATYHALHATPLAGARRPHPL